MSRKEEKEGQLLGVSEWQPAVIGVALSAVVHWAEGEAVIKKFWWEIEMETKGQERDGESRDPTGEFINYIISIKVKLIDNYKIQLS